MADMRRYAGVGPEMISESARDYQQAGVPGPRIIPTPEEARRAQEAALRAQVLVNQSVGGFGSHYEVGPQVGALQAAMYKDRPLVDALCARLAEYCGEGGRNEGAVETLDRLLSEVRAARQGPSHAPADDTLAQQLRAPGKMFSREAICAIIRGQMAITHDSHLRDLLTIFENLE